MQIYACMDLANAVDLANAGHALGECVHTRPI